MTMLCIKPKQVSLSCQIFQQSVPVLLLSTPPVCLWDKQTVIFGFIILSWSFRQSTSHNLQLENSASCKYTIYGTLQLFILTCLSGMLGRDSISHKATPWILMVMHTINGGIIIVKFFCSPSYNDSHGMINISNQILIVPGFQKPLLSILQYGSQKKCRNQICVVMFQ